MSFAERGHGHWTHNRVTDIYVMHLTRCIKCDKEVWVFGTESEGYVCNEHFIDLIAPEVKCEEANNGTTGDIGVRDSPGIRSK